ncbi:MAG: Gfo/Idh/MocA family oxidoreductase [SAR202 cluster bacterium]|nr:Gfo/Idh/MocA family oxidoreductase [SAR202 cluster bacterium]
MTRDKLRIGVLGAGAWADSAHIPGWNRDSRGERGVVSEVEAAKAEIAAAKHGIGDWSDDWQSVVSRSDIDVIDIVTPSHTHLELASAAIEAGKHVLCEKPVAFDFIETRRLADEARRKFLKT